jgi:hypothetical protein
MIGGVLGLSVCLRSLSSPDSPESSPKYLAPPPRDSRDFLDFSTGIRIGGFIGWPSFGVTEGSGWEVTRSRLRCLELGLIRVLVRGGGN